MISPNTTRHDIDGTTPCPKEKKRFLSWRDISTIAPLPPFLLPRKGRKLGECPTDLLPSRLSSNFSFSGEDHAAGSDIAEEDSQLHQTSNPRLETNDRYSSFSAVPTRFSALEFFTILSCQELGAQQLSQHGQVTSRHRLHHHAARPSRRHGERLVCPDNSITRTEGRSTDICLATNSHTRKRASTGSPKSHRRVPL